RGALAPGLTDDWWGVPGFVSSAARLAPDPHKADISRDGYRRYRDLYTRLSAPGATKAGSPS
ncbi:carbohydrate kinase, partial [Mesorhizobium sp. M7A.F.Ca.CA.001.08.1.1]